MKYTSLEQYQGMGQAAAIFGMFLPDSIGQYPQINVLSADMSVAASLDRFIYSNPEQFTEIGIAEQNLVGIAAGMASEGYTPIAVAQSAFITMRAFEMDRQYLGYMQNPVILVGLNSGFFLQYFGNTHYNTEDIALMRTIPNMTILSPADAGEAVVAMKAAIDCHKPVFIRLTGGSVAPTVYTEECDFEIGKNNIVRQGQDIAIYATGAMVGYALQASAILKEKANIDAKVIDVHTIKPLDTSCIEKDKDKKLIVSVEEHSIIGGLGSAISDFTSAESGYPAILKLGVKDCFSKPGDYTYLLEQHRLTPQFIAEDIINKLKKV